MAKHGLCSLSSSSNQYEGFHYSKVFNPSFQTLQLNYVPRDSYNNKTFKDKVFKLSPLDYGSNGPSQDMSTLKFFQVISRLAIPHKYYNWWEKDPTNLHSNEYKDKTRIEVH